MNILTSREKRAVVYAAIAAYGWFGGKGWGTTIAKLFGPGLLLHEAVGYAQDQKLFAFPETMNAYFKTDGKISAAGGNESAAKVIRSTKVVSE